MTDQEIIKHIQQLPDEKANDMEYSYTTGRNDGFLLGAKWMRDIVLPQVNVIKSVCDDDLRDECQRRGYVMSKDTDGYDD